MVYQRPRARCELNAGGVPKGSGGASVSEQPPVPPHPARDPRRGRAGRTSPSHGPRHSSGYNRVVAESFIGEEVATHIARNEKLRALITKQGASLDERRPIDFFFYAEDRPAALNLARDLEIAGFEQAQVGNESLDGKWSIHAVRFDSVTAITSPSFVEQMVKLAAQYLAEFDGWGAPI
jgi:hypothetical protein